MSENSIPEADGIFSIREIAERWGITPQGVRLRLKDIPHKSVRNAFVVSKKDLISYEEKVMVKELLDKIEKIRSSSGYRHVDPTTVPRKRVVGRKAKICPSCSRADIRRDRQNIFNPNGWSCRSCSASFDEGFFDEKEQATSGVSMTRCPSCKNESASPYDNIGEYQRYKCCTKTCGAKFYTIPLGAEGKDLIKIEYGHERSPVEEFEESLIKDTSR